MDPAHGRAASAPADAVFSPRPGRPLLSLGLAATFCLVPASRAAATCVDLVCPEDVTVATDSNQCGAVATYGAPIPIVIGIGGCDTIVCGPGSGSFFPVGTTQVGCFATAGASCSFGVTVSDVQAPQVTAPADSTVVGTSPGEPTIATYAPPLASDNCPGVITSCDPPSGSAFSSGDTTVTCTATDASLNTASDTFEVHYFDACVRDDAGGEFLRWRTADGVYEFVDCDESTCGGTGFLRTGTGIATPTRAGFGLRDDQGDRSVRASLAVGNGKGRARLKFRSASTQPSSKLKDASPSDDFCSCQ